MNAIAFVWDNFGPMHVDRCEAVQAHFGADRKVIGIEQFRTSDTYEWVPATGSGFRKVTLFADSDRKVGILRQVWAMISELRRCGAQDIVFCNYERPAIFLSAIAMRMFGRRCYVMGCSKFDDYQRTLRREVVKSLFFLPYCGGIASGKRAKDYMRFLGLRADCVFTEYNTLSIARIRAAAGIDPAPAGTKFLERHFTIVARFIPKKNLAVALQAYALYCVGRTEVRDLHLCGSGALEKELRALVAEFGLGDRVVFRGFLQSDEVAQVLGQTLCLLLPSVEEQFGNVVIEAQAMGVPVILSDNCGARDRLVRSGFNGFVVEPDNPQGMAWFMARIAEDEPLWQNFAAQSLVSAELGDVAQFAKAVAELVHKTKRKARRA